MKKISVILPCYNMEKYLPRCIESIVNQTIGLKNIEIILIDDASTDNTWNVIKDIESTYPDDVIAVHCDVNGRQGKARNIGLSYSSSEYIAFIDPDDWVEPMYLEDMYNAITKYSCDYVECQFKRDSNDTLSYFPQSELSTEKDSRFMTIDTVEKRKLFLYLKPVKKNCWAKLIRKSFLIDNNIYCPENLFYEDNYWSLILFLNTNNVFILEKNLYHYYVNQSSTVLKKNMTYHIDLLTVHEILWNEYISSNTLDMYYDELTLEFSFSCYLGFLKILALRYEVPSYSDYLLLRTLVASKVPDLLSNKYVVAGEISDIHLALLKTLYVELNRDEFLELLKSVEASGI